MKYHVENHGSICLVYADDDECTQWLLENVNGDAQHWCEALVVEPRYLGGLVRAMSEFQITNHPRSRRDVQDIDSSVRS